MKVKVDENACVGCGLCVDVCPKVFDLKDGVAKVVGKPGTKDEDASCREAASKCPVEAITVDG